MIDQVYWKKYYLRDCSLYDKITYNRHFRVTHVDQYKSWEFDIENDAIQGHWTGVFSQYGTMTNLEFTEDIIAKRFVIKPFVYFYLHQQQRRYIRDLKNKLRKENNWVDTVLL